MMSSSALEPTSPPAPSTTPSSPALRSSEFSQFHSSTPINASVKRQSSQVPLSVSLPPAPNTPPVICDTPALTPPPRSPGPIPGNCSQPLDGTSSDKSSETAVGSVTTPTAVALSRKESYKAQRQNYRKEKKRATSALLHSIEDPTVVLLADWLKVRGSLKSWTKLWCVLKPGLLLLYKSPKAKSSHWVGTVLLTSCQVIERPSKKDGFCFKLYHPLEQSIWAPRGPHNETIGAVVQPLPTAHLIFRAPSSAAGHCWLDGLERALRCDNAMLRCSSSRSRPEQMVTPETAAQISHEELEKHFNEHELAGAESDSESDGVMATALDYDQEKIRHVLARIRALYEEDTNTDVGRAGEIMEEVAEENKSLIWFLLKQVRPGMDLSKVVLPTFILEPRSFLDKLSDSYYHADILAEASNETDAYTRFKIVLRWYLSGLYRKPRGLKKPYNPVLGERFRCCWKNSSGDNNYTYYVSEQVSHHPPVSAFYVSNRKDGYVVEGSLLAKSKFYGNSTSALLEGCARVHLLKWNETYITTAPYMHCKGILLGTLVMEYGGKVQVICTSNNYNAEIEFKMKTLFQGQDATNVVSGKIRNGKEVVAHLEGHWDTKVEFRDKNSGDEVLTDVSTLKEHRLPRYLVRMESQDEFESQRLWARVSEAINRDDQTTATAEKTKVEESQRDRSRANAGSYSPKYFYQDSNLDAPEGVVDQGWRYSFRNISPWKPTEIIEFEDNFKIRTISPNDTIPVALPTPTALSDVDGPRPGLYDSDTEEERRVVKPPSLVSKSLTQLEQRVQEQSAAIDRLTRRVERMGGQGRQRMFAMDVVIGIVIGMMMYSLLTKLLY